MEDNNNILGLVIVDGVGFRNFILSNFLKEAEAQFDEIIIYSGLPKRVYKGFLSENCIIEELDDFKEPAKTWFFRKVKEIAHLQNNKKNNFGIKDNLRANYPNTWNKRGIITRLIFLFTSFFHSENWISIFHKNQQKSISNQLLTIRHIKLLKNHKPDILFFTHQRPPYIAPLLYAAEQNEILTASFIFSWDNLASKGRMAGNFDFYLVWSDLMKKELKQFYKNIKNGQIYVVGTPQFEPYVMERYSTNKEEFLLRFKLDANLKIICYSCGDVSTSKNDGLYIETIAQAMEANAFGQRLNLLVRTSPAEDEGRFKVLMEKYQFIKWNIPQWELSRKEHSEPWSQRVPSVTDVKDLRAILTYCDVGINMCSTMSLDFMNFDKPVINPVFGNENNGLYDDQRFLKYAHYERVAKSNAVSIVKNKDELIAAINKALKDPAFQKEERKKMLRLQVSKPLEGTGKRIAVTLKNV